MNLLTPYLLSVIGAALICSVVKQVLHSASYNAVLIRFICGLVMVLTLLAPLQTIHISGINSILDAYSLDAEQYISEGQQRTDEKLRETVMQSYKNYVSGEANKLGIRPEIEITLSEDALPRPSAIYLNGEASPYIRSALTQTLSDALGIEKEQIKWT